MGGNCTEMPRFFIKPQDIVGDTIKITGEDFDHIKKVLRLKPNDKVTVNDRSGTDYEVLIENFESDFVKTRLLSSLKNNSEPPINVTLYQGVPKSDKMDLIIQKSVELGVREIVPVITHRTIVKFDGQKDVKKKLERWNRIALEASKQSERGFVPNVREPVSFLDAIKCVKTCDLGIIPYEKEKEKGIMTLLKDNKEAKSIAFFVGPEGGFTDEEIINAMENGLKSVTLGPRILRTETAGIAVLSILMYELGDVGL